MRPAYRRRAARRRKWLRRLAPVAVALLVVVALRLALRASGMIVRPLREMPCDAVFFYQEDAAWADDAMGDSGRTLGKSGDGVACLAALMAMEHLPAPFEGTVNPGTLNAWLSENGGYDADGNPRWDHIAQLLGFRHTEKAAQGDVNAVLDRLIQAEVYPMARVKRPDTGAKHEVLLVGSVHGEYTIVDPLDPTGTLNTLGLYGNKIYGLRYFEQENGEEI